MRLYESKLNNGAVACAEFEDKRQHKSFPKEELRLLSDREILALERFSNNIESLSHNLEVIQASLNRIENTLSRYETQYFYPFTLIDKK